MNERGGEQRNARVYARRYAPLAAIVAVQLFLLTLMPTTKSSPTVVEQSASPAEGAATDQGSALTVDSGSDSGQAAAEGGAGAPVASGAPSGSAGARTGAAGATATTAVAATGGAAKASGSTGGQQADELGRPLAGDKSRCAPGGLLQENISVSSPPCMPAFVGDNGGATAPGVTGDTITVVISHPQYDPASQRALQAGGLAASTEQYAEADELYSRFIEKHYELYGRKLKVYDFYTAAADPAAYRAAAKELVAKFRPFAVAYYAPMSAPDAFLDQLSQLGVINIGARSMSDLWFKTQAPYSWTLGPQGNRAADMLADYYCKRMWGKNATRAGDPTMQVKKRKLGIVSISDDQYLQTSLRFKQQVTGGQCGSAADGTTLYTRSADATQAQNEAPVLTTRMKNDGITTRVDVFDLVGSREDDRQNYFPENLFAGTGAQDDDLVGKVYAATRSPNQMANSFGLGWLPAMQPEAGREYVKVAKSINPQYQPPYVVQGTWMGLNLLSKLIQWAGPKLTAQNVEKGAHSSPQLYGWKNPTPWPGWKCCDKYAPMWFLSASPTTYSAWADARQVVWSSSAISPSDNTPGAFVCVDDCKRYPVGGWTPGEPGQP